MMLIALALVAAAQATPPDPDDCVRPRPIPSTSGHPHKHITTRYHPHRLFKTEPKPKIDETPCEQTLPPITVELPPEVPDVPLVSIPPEPGPGELPPMLITPLFPPEGAPPEQGYPGGGGGWIELAGSGGFGGGGGYIAIPCAVCVAPCPDLVVPSPIPEPAEYALVLIGLVLVRWRTA